MAPQFPMPPHQTLFAFVLESTLTEREDISPGEVISTFERRTLHPSAAGHFSAIKYGIDLAKREDFPARHPVQWETIAKADTNTYWLRDIHKKLMIPSAEYGEIYMNPHFIKRKDCGPYRLNERTLAGIDDHQSIVGRPLPRPTDISKLIHIWYKTIGQFHLQISAVLRRPSPADLRKIEEMAWKAHLQLQCIHPWTDGTGRSARIIENILRLRWGLPWKPCDHKEVVSYIAQIKTYEDGPEWQTILKSMK